MNQQQLIQFVREQKESGYDLHQISKHYRILMDELIPSNRYYDKNTDRCKEKSFLYYQKYKERMQAQKKKYQQDNKERLKQRAKTIKYRMYQIRYYQKNREKILDKRKKAYQNLIEQRNQI